MILQGVFVLICSLETLKGKEVINAENGERLGFIDDVEFNLKTAEIASFVIYGRERLFGLLGREENIVISCEEIKVIGTDVILIVQKERKFANSTNASSNGIKSLLKW